MDCHVNNLYNTCFWALVADGLSNREAEKVLAPTYSKDKHELLFSKFGINYAKVEPRFRKGTILMRIWEADPEKVRVFEE